MSAFDAWWKIEPSYSEVHRVVARAAFEAGRTQKRAEPVAPYLCISPACGTDCTGCNSAISQLTVNLYAIRYAWLRKQSDVDEGVPYITLDLTTDWGKSARRIFDEPIDIDDAIDDAMSASPAAGDAT